MVDPRGFLDCPRREARKEPAHQRIRHWREYIAVMDDAQSASQANRCMDCGTPYCHRYCPVYNLIPEWNALVSEGDWRRAYEVLDATNNFPEFTGRVCPAPCEDACTLSLGDRPVTIKAIELAIVERAWRAGWVRPQPPPRRTGKRIAVVGSGPAGLACAQQLARAGHCVALYEKADRLGGLLRYGIPDFKLDKRLIDRRLAQLRAEGVEFHTGVEVGADIESAALRRRCDALVLACGAGQARDLGVPGRALRGIHYAIRYLAQQNRRCAGDGLAEEEISARGKEVVVIGGGDTGSDCIGTAIRQGARRVTQVQYHERPPLRAEVRAHWPAPAPVLRTSDAQAEGAARLWGWDTVAFEGAGERVAALLLQRLEWRRGANGAWQKILLPGPRRRLAAQLVLLAMGYAHTLHAGSVERLGLALDGRGNVRATDRDYHSSAAGVFACGDARRGQSLVVWAIREGRQCAQAVDAWLMGRSDLPRV